MLKRLLLSAVILSAVGVSSYAVDVNIPGADPTISKDAYQNYRKVDTTAKKMEADVGDKVRAKYANNMPKKWTIDELVYLTQELNHSVNFSSSVFILKDNGANLKFTFPEGTQFGKTIKGDPLTTEIKHGNFLLIDGNLNYNIRKENQSTSTGNSFFYPTVKNATWEISPTKTGSLEGAINFKVKAEPSVSYRIAFDLTKKKEVELLKIHDQEYVYKQLMSPLVNYVLPSIEPAKQLLSKTKPITINGFTFQTLKSSDLTYNGPDNDAIYIYDGKDAFTEYEYTTIKELIHNKPSVIATGGGTVTYDKTVKLMRNNGLVNRDVNHILDDLDLEIRPLVKESIEYIFNVYEERYPLYEKVAHIKIGNEGSITDAVQEIIEALPNTEK